MGFTAPKAREMRSHNGARRRGCGLGALGASRCLRGKQPACSGSHPAREPDTTGHLLTYDWHSSRGPCSLLMCCREPRNAGRPGGRSRSLHSSFVPGSPSSPSLCTSQSLLHYRTRCAGPGAALPHLAVSSPSPPGPPPLAPWVSGLGAAAPHPVRMSGPPKLCPHTNPPRPTMDTPAPPGTVAPSPPLG